MLRRLRQRTRRAGVILLAGTALAGCGSKQILKTPPSRLLEIRAGLRRVELRASDAKVELRFRRPAKGVVGGAGRGLVIGAAAPIVVGAVLPVPGTTFFAALLSPFTGVIGAVWGAIVALPADEVTRAEASIDAAVAEMGRDTPQRSLARRILELAPGRADALVYEATAEDTSRPDAILETKIEAAGLEGEYSIDPPSSSFVEVHARLLAGANGEVLLEDAIRCVGDEHSYVDWARDDGALFTRTLRACFDPLAERLVDDFFLLYPQPTWRQ